MAGGQSDVKIVIVSEHPCCRLGLATILSGVDADASIIEATSTDHSLELVRESGIIDLIVFDTAGQLGREMEAISNLQDLDGVGATMVIHEEEQPQIARRYLDMGVEGVVPKTIEPAVLVNAVRLVLSGGRYVPENVLNKDAESFASRKTSIHDESLQRLTRRQLDVLKELGKGSSNQEIGSHLGIALATVKLHVNAILNTLGVRNRTEAAIIAYRAGLTDFGS